MCYMRKGQVGVRELRQNLSVYLRRVKRGEVLEVTERGQPVAQLGPLRASDDPIERLRAAGRIMFPATRSFEDVPPPLKMTLPITMSEALQMLRKNER